MRDGLERLLLRSPARPGVRAVVHSAAWTPALVEDPWARAFRVAGADLVLTEPEDGWPFVFSLANGDLMVDYTGATPDLEIDSRGRLIFNPDSA